MEPADLITTKTAAKILKLSKPRINQFVNDGRLKPIEIDGVRFFLRADVAALAKQPRPEGRPKTKPAPKKGKKD